MSLFFGPPRPDSMPPRQDGPVVIGVRQLVPVLLVDGAFVALLLWLTFTDRLHRPSGIGGLTLLHATLLAFAIVSLVVLHVTVIRPLQRARRERAATVWERP